MANYFSALLQSISDVYKFAGKSMGPLQNLRTACLFVNNSTSFTKLIAPLLKLSTLDPCKAAKGAKNLKLCHVKQIAINHSDRAAAYLRGKSNCQQSGQCLNLHFTFPQLRALTKRAKAQQTWPFYFAAPR